MKISRVYLVQLLRQQSIFLSLAAVVIAVFWATGQRINPGTVILYSVLFGNMVSPMMQAMRPLYWKRPFPWNWVCFWAIVLVIVGPVFTVCSLAVWWLAPPTPQTLGHLLRTGWKFPALIIVVFSSLEFLYHTTKDRLEQRNRELQRKVQAGTAQLEVQKQELQRAREIQESLLPKNIPQLAGFEVAAAWKPAREVSGDYFDVFRLGDHKVGLCIADVVGKGVSAALLMANVQAAVRAFASETESPASICGKVNRLLCENIATGKFVTFLYGILDCETHSLEWCNAGHPDPILVSAEGARGLNGGGAVLGVFPNWQYSNECIQIKAGDRLLLFTDGITEAAGTDEVEFGEERITRFAQSHCESTASDLNRTLLDEADAFCGSHFRDDATLLVIAAT
jgi:phosphoserine phosphatase RsbU/P